MTLAFERVDAELGNGLRATALQLAVPAGGCLAVHGPAAARAAFADLVLGLRLPHAGAVAVGGVRWSALPPARRAAHRERIGAALARAAFLSNLDVAENLVLAERLQHGRPAAAVLDEATALCARLSFGPIPDCRPYALDAAALHRLSIVRALLGARPLLLLEDAFGALDGAPATALFDELQARRDAGACVAWLAGAPAPDALRATAVLDLLRCGGREDAA